MVINIFLIRKLKQLKCFKTLIVTINYIQVGNKHVKELQDDTEVFYSASQNSKGIWYLRNSKEMLAAST